MWPDPVVLSKPDIDGCLCLFCCVEPFCIEHLVPQRAVEPFIVTVLPRTARIDLDGPDADPVEPFPWRLGNEPRSGAGHNDLLN